MSEKTAGASLRILTKEISPRVISETLGLPPSRQHLKGELRSKRNPLSSVFEENLWIYESPLSSSCELHEHIDAILQLLESKGSALDAIRDRCTAIDVFCMFSSENGQGSAELSLDLLRRLAKQQVDLIIDLYPPGSPD